MDERYSWICHWWAVALMGLIESSISDRPLVFFLFSLRIRLSLCPWTRAFFALRLLCHTPPASYAFNLDMIVIPRIVFS